MFYENARTRPRLQSQDRFQVTLLLVLCVIEFRTQDRFHEHWARMHINIKKKTNYLCYPIKIGKQCYVTNPCERMSQINKKYYY